MSPTSLASQNLAKANRSLSTPTVAGALDAGGTLFTHWLAEAGTCPRGFLIAPGVGGAGSSCTILQLSFLGQPPPGTQILGPSFHF